mmetsp:Transcript_27674/g.64965  ORF Transcript_27674/g.64965 Transcript_27674/m.64965 type:complete len:282 (+) Transcript_27674:48-893(+)
MVPRCLRLAAGPLGSGHAARGSPPVPTGPEIRIRPHVHGGLCHQHCSGGILAPGEGTRDDREQQRWQWQQCRCRSGVAGGSVFGGPVRFFERHGRDRLWIGNVRHGPGDETLPLGGAGTQQSALPRRIVYGGQRSLLQAGRVDPAHSDGLLSGGLLQPGWQRWRWRWRHQRTTRATTRQGRPLSTPGDSTPGVLDAPTPGMVSIFPGAGTNRAPANRAGELGTTDPRVKAGAGSGSGAQLGSIPRLPRRRLPRGGHRNEEPSEYHGSSIVVGPSGTRVSTN